MSKRLEMSQLSSQDSGWIHFDKLSSKISESHENRPFLKIHAGNNTQLVYLFVDDATVFYADNGTNVSSWGENLSGRWGFKRCVIGAKPSSAA